jgi:hypothetical protein
MQCNQLHWLEAQDRAGRSWVTRRVIPLPVCNHQISTQGYTSIVFTQGTRPVLLFTSEKGDILALPVPASPMKADWPLRTLVTGTGSDKGLAVGDVNGDRQPDLCAGYQTENKQYGIVWWSDVGKQIRSPSTGWKRELTGVVPHKPDRLAIADCNGDGRADVVACEGRWPGKEPDAGLYWFEQGASGWKKHLVVTQYSMNSLAVADLDGDGDQDLVVGEHKGPALRLQTWENDGKGRFTERLMDTGKEHHIGTRLVDLDRDGDLDVISFGWDQHQFLHSWRNE